MGEASFRPPGSIGVAWFKRKAGNSGDPGGSDENR
jgi:hypothetical protein